MTVIRVRCPDCSAILKLKKQIEKVKCPRCQVVFTVADNRVKSVTRKPAAESPAPPNDPWDLDDDSGLSEDLPQSPPPRQASKKSAKSAQGKRPTKKASTGAINLEEFRRFGLTLLGFGVAAFLLPLFGLQIKGLHALSPQAQVNGGMALILIGGVVTLLSFSSRLGTAAEFGWQTVKWGVFGTAGLLALIVAFVVVRGFVGRQPGPAPNLVAQNGNNMDPAAIHAMHMQNMTNSSGGPRQGGGPGSPLDRPAFESPQARAMRQIQQRLEEFGPDKIVTVKLFGFEPGVHLKIRDQLKTLASPQVSTLTGQSPMYEIRMAPVDDVQALADQVDFANVVNVNTTSRTIRLMPATAAESLTN